MKTFAKILITLVLIIFISICVYGIDNGRYIMDSELFTWLSFISWSLILYLIWEKQISKFFNWIKS